MIDICCIGHITKDRIITPQRTVNMSGGTAYYFAHALRCLPAEVSYSLITAMHPDDAAPVNQLRSEGISVTMHPSEHTVFFENAYGVNTDERSQRVLAVADPFTIAQLADVEARVYHLGSLLSNDFSPEVVEYLAHRGRVSIDVQGYLREVRGERVYPVDWQAKRQVLRHTYYLKVNETEMQTITHLCDPREAAALLHEWGVVEVIITLGSEGSLVYVDGEYYDIPAYPPTAVVDATGCGDTYSAGYLYCRLQGLSPAYAGRYAAAMCTLKLEHNGPFCHSQSDILRIMFPDRNQPTCDL